MAKPPRKHSVEERTAYLNNPARLEKEASLVEQNQMQLKQEAISRFEETKRKRTDNYDELSVVSATKRPKIQHKIHKTQDTISDLDPEQ